MMMILLCLLLMSPRCINSMEEEISIPCMKKIKKAMEITNSIVCLELNPDWYQMPDDIKNSPNKQTDNEKREDIILYFLKEAIDCTDRYVSAYKIPYKCYVPYLDVLKKIISHIQDAYPLKPIILDLTAADIKNTMIPLSKNFFIDLKVDAITVEPYREKDLTNFVSQNPQYTEFIVIQSSNPSEKEVREAPVNYKNPLTNEQTSIKLWQYMLILLVEKWHHNKNLGAVISDNLNREDYQWIRKTVGEEFYIFVSGADAQGDNSANFISYLVKNDKNPGLLVNDKNPGLLVNVYSGILYCYKNNDLEWRKKIKSAAAHYRNEFNEYRF